MCVSGAERASPNKQVLGRSFWKNTLYGRNKCAVTLGFPPTPCAEKYKPEGIRVRVRYPPHFHTFKKKKKKAFAHGQGVPASTPAHAMVFPGINQGLNVRISVSENYPGGSLSSASCCAGLSSRRCLLCASLQHSALLVLQLLQQEQDVVSELIPRPPHPTKLHRLQTGVGRLVQLRAADLVQEEPGAVRVHMH